MTNINVFQGDYGYDINFTLQDAVGGIFDITGATLKLVTEIQGVGSTKFSGTMSIVSPTAGTCKYNVAQGNFNTIGTYYADVVATIGSEVVTFGDINITVKPIVPRNP